MSYEDFKKEYLGAFKTMMNYHPNEVGSLIWAEKMSELEDKFPSFAKQAEEEA